MQNRKQTFLGTGWDFPPTFRRQTGGVDLVADEKDIYSSIGILLSTEMGERIMQPRYGCDLNSFIFQPLNVGVRTRIEKIVKDAITMNEPRIVFESVSITYIPMEGKVSIDIWGTVITTNTRYNFVYPFYQKEGTNLSV